MRIKPYLSYIGVAAAVLLAGLLAAYLNLKQRVPVSPSGPATTLILLRPGKPLPAFALQGDDGKPFTRASLSGHWSLLYFGYTGCTDTCPVTMAALTKMMARLGDLPTTERPQVEFISIDPDHDTPAKLRSYVKYFDEDFTAATGSIEQLRSLANSLSADVSDVPPDMAAMHSAEHPARILVIDPRGNEVAIYTQPLIPERMADNFRFILKLNGLSQ